MKYLLFIVAVLALLSGLLGMLIAQTSVNEIQSLLMFLLAAVCMSGAGIISAVDRLRAEIRDQTAGKG